LTEVAVGHCHRHAGHAFTQEQRQPLVLMHDLARQMGLVAEQRAQILVKLVDGDPSLGNDDFDVAGASLAIGLTLLRIERPANRYLA
jgi:hypothetical protein